MVEEVSSILIKGVEGIGLYRTEFLYSTEKTFLLEDEHFKAYKDVVEKVSLTQQLFVPLI